MLGQAPTWFTRIEKMKRNPSILINDEQELIGAKSRFGYPIKTYDDGWGQLFIHRDSMGISGIVRARTWDDAYGICEDEFFPEADETVEQMEKEFSKQYLTGRELWLHLKTEELGSKEAAWNAWIALTEAEREAVYASLGQTVPFPSEAGGWEDHPCWQEQYGLRPNGPRRDDKHGHGIYAKDLNGDALDVLTPEFLKELEITLEIKDV